MDPLALFSAPTRAWFTATFERPSPPQALGWPAIARGEHSLLLAPTGSGKTLAAFLFCLDRVAVDLQAGRALDGVQVLYVSPLKALSNDLSRNLERPLAGIRTAAEALGRPLPELTVGLRTGDTPAKERARLSRRPPHVLCTTPESLYLLLTSRARESLRAVRWVIVDEIHALAGNKRGVHLALTLERLEALIAASGHAPPVRIGLSATQRPLEAIGAYLGGTSRPVTLLDTGTRKALEVLVDTPVDDLQKLPESTIWPTLGPYVAELVTGHHTTLVFVNDRRASERLVASINDALGQPAARAHHGALSRRTREEVEAQLKAGDLPALVCTSSLELGIDVGSVELVVQVSSPGGVARALQRIGRAGHALEGRATGRIVPRFRGDLVECAALIPAVLAAAVETTQVPEKCLDVLAQQIVAMAAVDTWRIDDLLAVLRRAWSYRDLTRAELEAVLEMLGGRYPAEELPELSPRIVWDRVSGTIRGRPGALRVAVTSGGTIPDRGLYPVELGEGGPRLGELDEEFVYESRPGDVFQLGSGTWRIEAISPNKVVVSPAPGEPPGLPFWHGEGPGRSAELGDRVGALCRRFEEEPDAEGWLEHDHHLTPRAARNLAAYLAEQRKATGALPTDRRVVVEHFTDDLGDARIAVHLPLGKRVTTPLALLLARRLADVIGGEPSFSATDDGVLLRLPAAEAPPPANPLALLSGVEVERTLAAALGETTLFGTRFRDNAARALLLPRRAAGKRTPLYLQRLRARDLLAVAQRHPEFPVLVETYRECLRDAWDLPRLSRLLTEVAEGRVAVHVSESRTPSPFAASLLFGFVMAFQYGDDLPRAERRAQLLPVGRGLLAGLLGTAEQRELIDPSILADEEARATRTAPRLRARDADELHDLLRRLGPLTAEAVACRVTAEDGGRAHLAALIAAGRAVEVDGRFHAAEDLDRYRAARDGDAAAISALTRRALRAAGPRPLAELADAADLPADAVEAALEHLVSRGQAARGHFRPDEPAGAVEYIDAELLERLHRRSLAAARRAVRPVEAAQYADFLVRWHRLTPQTRAEGPAGLAQALEALAGFPLPAEQVEREFFARRLRAYDPAWLDRRISEGEWTFTCSPFGSARTPRVTFWPRADLGPPGHVDVPEDSAEARVLAHLQARGASFYSDLWSAVDLDAATLAEALWQLLVGGAITNDRFEVVRRGRAGVGPERLVAYRSARASRVAPRLQSGRWSLVGSAPADAEWWARRLLDRYGVVTREHVAAERPPPSWRDLLAVWKRLELRGEVRRGYFVEGLSGAQFAWPAAVELLRAEASPATVALPVLDPACAYGPVLPLDVARLASNFVVLRAGQPVLIFESGARRVRTLGAAALDLAAAALATLGGTLEIETVDGEPAIGSRLDAPLRAAGFELDGRRLRRSPLGVRPLSTDV